MSAPVRHQGANTGSGYRERPHAAPPAPEPVYGPPTASELAHALPAACALAAIAYVGLVIVLGSASWPS